MGCGESFDKLKKTEQIVKEYDNKNDGKFFIEANIEGDKSELNVTLDHELFEAYYSTSLYEIILELRKNNLSYNHYSIKPPNGEIIWQVNDAEIENLTKTINQAKKIIQLLESGENEEFIALSNFKSIGIPDSVIFNSLALKPIYPNTEYKGFSMIEEEINGRNSTFMKIYFMNEELKENKIVISPTDKLVYGIEY